jgi:hypothetical protein
MFMSSEHTVQPGDCIASIAYEHGFYWQTLWDHPDNAELKKKRESGFQLLPGDVVCIPDLRIEEVAKAPEAKHRFKLKGVPSILIVVVRRFKDGEQGEEGDADEASDEPQSVAIEEPAEAATEEEPDAGVAYRVEIGPRKVSGEADSSGKIKISIMPNDRMGMLVIAPGTPREREIPLLLGGLDPLDALSGVAQRLNNLGYGPVSCGGDVSETELADALGSFQKASGLKPTGRVDAASRDKLKEMHGS